MEIEQMELKKAKAFTLIEILLTLGIIGIIGAITIPNLITNYKIKVTRNRLIDTQAILSQALKMAIYENGSPEGWDIGTYDSHDGARKLYDILSSNTVKIQSCRQVKKGCFGSSYKALDGKSNFRGNPSLDSVPTFSSGQFINGVSFLTWSIGSGCASNGTCGTILVDINGPSKPNRAGFDLFEFTIKKDVVIPSGGRGADTSVNWTRCGYTSGNDNGTRCTAWLIEKGNMDYLKKEIKWD
jgi:prepilin-type N-terminal cleavage/methylation domain-containing protein